MSEIPYCINVPIPPVSRARVCSVLESSRPLKSKLTIPAPKSFKNVYLPRRSGAALQILIFSSAGLLTLHRRRCLRLDPSHGVSGFPREDAASAGLPESMAHRSYQHHPGRFPM
ncbi:hypothetical protein KSP40_PGU018313 [Platanthera guangdongensis]|uniref:Uncharacterized protein n=1 Tax=Platanthera guangdongensis TaxID=2320717 RepID=A0ABR2LP20_9ASPA